MTIKYDYNFNIFTNENAISYYLLGAFITDGCVYKNNPTTYACQLSSCDVDWLESIAKVIGNNLKLHKFKNNYFGIRIMRNHIAQWFIEHGCHPRKTYNVQLPNIPNKYFNSFLLGCIDGDGSLGTYYYKNSVKRCCQLISASYTFLQQIQNQLSLIDIKSSIINRGKQNSTINDQKIIATTNLYSLSFYGKDCYKLLKYLYSTPIDICLKRKMIKAKEIINHYLPLEN